jgi:cell division protein YceG involved in septum cleavage
MVEKNDYTNLSLEELVKKQKTISNWQKIFIVVVVFSVLNVFYAIYMKTKMHPFLILGSLFFLINNGSKLKKVEAEIEKQKN